MNKHTKFLNKTLANKSKSILKKKKLYTITKWDLSQEFHRG